MALTDVKIPVDIQRVLALGFVLASWVGIGFWYFSTEAVNLKVSSGQWWFYLAMSMLFVVVGMGALAKYLKERRSLMLLGLLGLALVVALVVLGLEHQPFDPTNLQLKRGLEMIINPGDKYRGEELVDLDVDDNGTILPGYKGIDGGVSYEKLLPEAMDQGECGSCWAVAAAGALSARYNKVLVDQKLGMSTRPQYSCPRPGFDVKHWYFSPQYILDSINDEASVARDCTLGGKCNGNYIHLAMDIARYGVPDSKCVPYFADSTGPCSSKCGAPTDPNYYFCGGSPSGGNVTQERCLKAPGLRWTKCADGSAMTKVAETYEPVLVRGESAMLKELDDHGPLVCGINFYREDKVNAAWTLTGRSAFGVGGGGYDSYLPSGGYVSDPAEDGDQYSSNIGLGGHAVVVYGYGVGADGRKYWNVRNSWGANWGNNGNSKIARGYVNDGDNTAFRGAWGIEDQCFAAKVRPH